MHRVEPSLSRWRELYAELSAAQDRLVTATEHPRDGIDLGALKAKVARLQDESEAALDAIHTQIAAIRSNPGARASRVADRPS